MPLEEVHYIEPSYPIVFEPETVEVLKLVRGKDEIEMLYLNAFLNRKIREALLLYYGEKLENKSEINFREAIRQKYATR